MGRFPMAAEVFNCSTSDTGNMEVLARYGTERQKKDWLGRLVRLPADAAWELVR